MTSDPDRPRSLDVEERAELDRLRAELAQLHEHPTARRPDPPARRRWVRSVAAALLIGVSCVLAPLSVVSVWARGEVTDTDRYVDTVAPLARDPAVQRAITANLTELTFRYVGVEALTTQALTALGQRDLVPAAVGAQLPALAVPISNGVRSFTQDRIAQVVASDAFAQAWTQANRTAHEQLVRALSGEGGAVTVSDGAVRVDLAAFLTVVKQRLVDSGFTLAERIPAVDVTFTVFESTDVRTVQRAFNALDAIGFWLPLILVALAAFGVYLAPNHRLAFIGAGWGVAAAMLVTAVALHLARNRYLAGIPTHVLPPDAAAVLIDTLLRYLREAVRAVALVGVLLALGAVLCGPSTTATAARRWCVTTLALAKGGLAGLGLQLDDVTRRVAPRARLVRGLTVAVALAVVLLERYRTPALVLWLGAIVLVVSGLVTFLAVPPRRRGGARPDAPPAGRQG